MKSLKLAIGSALLIALSTTAAFAQGTTVVLHDGETISNTTMTANVVEQCEVTVPSNIGFDVQNVTGTTTSAGNSVSVENIVLSQASDKIRLSLTSNGTGFVHMIGEAPDPATWAASDVTWLATGWTAGEATGFAGTLSNTLSETSEVATSAPGVASFHNTDLTFKLAPNELVTRSGDHQIDLIWKVEVIQGI